MGGRPSGIEKARLFFGSRIALIASEKHNQINSERIHNKPERQPKSIACLVARPCPARTLERAAGIEPAFGAWEAAVLPLNYARSRLITWFIRDRKPRQVVNADPRTHFETNRSLIGYPGPPHPVIS